MNDLRRSLAFSGALLFAVGMWTGLWAAAALTKTVMVPIPHLALATHLNGLLGGLWLIAVALTLEFLSYGDVGKRRLALLCQLSAWANWLVTAAASVLGVTGLKYTPSLRNDAVAAMLQLFVVLPGLVGATAWAYGFRKAR